MQLTITIEADNAAFEDDNTGPELARILKGLAGKLAGGVVEGDTFPLFDINGNRVGEAVFAE